MTTKFEIRTGGEKGTLWGFARTMESAAKRAEKLSRKIRTDTPVCIVADGKVVAKTGASSSGIAGFTRPLEAV